MTTDDELPPRLTISEALARQLRDEIRDGRLAPGSRLRQGETARRLGVSSTPVREAFAALEREGLLVTRPHRGAIVFRPTLEDLQFTYEIRIPLESLATEKAVPNMTAADLVELKRLFEKMTPNLSARQYSAANGAFHSAIYACAKRPALERMIADLRDASAAYMRIYAKVHPGATDTERDHRRIYEACAAGDAKGAAEAMAAHLRHTVEFASLGLPIEDSA